MPSQGHDRTPIFLHEDEDDQMKTSHEDK